MCLVWRQSRPRPPLIVRVTLSRRPLTPALKIGPVGGSHELGATWLNGIEGATYTLEECNTRPHEATC